MPRVYDSPEQADFSSFYTAGKIVQRGLSSHLYDWDLQLKSRASFRVLAPFVIGPCPTCGRRSRRYCLFHSAIFLPASFAVLDRIEPRPRRRNCDFTTSANSRVGPLFLAGSTTRRIQLLSPLLMAWRWGRISLFCSCWSRSLSSSCTVVAISTPAVFWALGLIKFQLVLPIVLVLAIKKRFRTLTGFSVVVVLLLGVGVWLVGLSEAVSYRHIYGAWNQDPAAQEFFQHDAAVRGACSRVGRHRLAQANQPYSYAQKQNN